MASRQLSLIDMPATAAPGNASAALAPRPIAAVSRAARPGPPEVPVQQAEWLCVYLPQLPSEVFISDAENPDLLVVSEPAKGRPMVQNAAIAAIQQGIYPGLNVPAAYTLCAAIDVRQRDPHKEQLRLQYIAERLYQFSSQVSLQPPNKLLLEVAASYSLFGGRAAFFAQLKNTLRELGHRVRLAAAATPKAAEWLAEWQRQPGQSEGQLQSLRQRINQLPLAALGDKQTSKLKQLGCNNLGDVLRLPRAGLARRFGPPLLQQLDRALGHQPDPRLHYRPPLHFAETLELSAELDTLDQFWPGVEQLLARLQNFLRDHNRCTRWLELQLRHANKPASVVPLRLLRATANAERLSKLLYGQLEQQQLAAPVRALSLQLNQLQASRPQTADSLNSDSSDQENWLETLERLQLRLGANRVHGLILQNSHQPETAWSLCAPTSANEVKPVLSARPNWLLPTPRKISEHERQAITLSPGCERIGAAWWEADKSLSRDYFIGTQPNGQQLWLYQNSQGWFCHGIYS